MQHNTIRWAVAKDIEVLEHLEIECYGQDQALNADQLLKRIAEPSCGALVATIAGQVIGYLLFHVKTVEDRMIIFRVGVCPLHRRLGWARSLFEKAQAQLQYHRQGRCSSIVAVVHERNLPGQLLAKSVGMHLDQIIRGMFDPDDAYVFEKTMEHVASSRQNRKSYLAQN